MRNELHAAVAHLEAMAQNAIGAAADADMPEQQKTALWAEYKALDTALAALLDAMQRQPDPDTGLVPCGCGGKAEFYEPDDEFYMVGVECSQCYVSTCATCDKEHATHDWNRAIGCYKGGAE